MFAQLERLPDDPILGLSALFRADQNPRKVDLTVGVYMDETGRTPIMRAVRDGERRYTDAQATKAYIGIAGDAGFIQEMERLTFGPDVLHVYGQRLRSVQTPGGCAALYAAGMLIRQTSPTGRIWVSDPTWSNHVPLFTAVGLEVLSYPYARADQPSVPFDEMMAALSRARPGDAVLLHGCCHNPTGIDLNFKQWSAVLDLVESRGLLPLVDLAYQGFGAGLEDDVVPVRALVTRVPEALITLSCSKNFGLYRDRVGMLCVLADSEQAAIATHSQVLKIARCSYSMPPAHGATVVQTVLSTPDLKADWQQELADMRDRITVMRHRLVEALDGRQVTGMGYLIAGNGMFSLLPLSKSQVQELRQQYGIYVVDSGRINLCGLTDANIDYVADALSLLWRVAS